MAQRSQAGTTRKPLSRERVLHAAVALADEGGIEALSMRKLAQELGVEAMSLYNHVANKDDIMNGIADHVAAEIDFPAGGPDWKSDLRRIAISAHGALSRHSWAPSVWMTRRTAGPAQLRYGESLLRTLREAGFSKDLTYHAFHSLQGHVLGFTLQEVNFQFDAETIKELAAKFLLDFPSDEYPFLDEHIRQHIELSHEHGGAFEFGLDLIIDALERLRDADSRSSGDSAVSELSRKPLAQ